MRVVSNSRANNVQVMDAAEVPGGPIRRITAATG